MPDTAAMHDEHRAPLSHILKRSYLSRFFCRIIYAILTPPGIFISRLWFGIRVTNKDILWSYSSGGCFIVSNHVYYLDPLIILYALYPAKPIFSVLEKTMQLKGLGAFLHLMGCFAIPTKRAMAVLTPAINDMLQQCRFIHFFPEGRMQRNSQTLMRFRKGVFYLAYHAAKPIIPMTLVLHSRYLGKWKLSFLPKKVEVVVGKPIDPRNYQQEKNSADMSEDILERSIMRQVIQKMQLDTYNQMQTILQNKV